MTSALLTESWDSVQRLVEALRPSMLKVGRLPDQFGCSLQTVPDPLHGTADL